MKRGHCDTPARGGGEQDALTKWRRLLCVFERPRLAKWWKSKWNKRARREARRQLRDE